MFVHFESKKTHKLTKHTAWVPGVIKKKVNDVNYLVCCENKDWLVHVSRLLQRSGMNNDKTQTNIANDSRNSSDSTPPISVQAGHKEIDASKDDDEEHSPTLRRVECGDSLEDDDYNDD